MTLDQANAATDLVEKHMSSIPRRGGGTQAEHCARVAAQIAEYDFPSFVVIAALLHDIVEDTPITHEDIRGWFGESIAELVRALTRDPRKNGNKQTKAHLADVQACGGYAVAIKLADNIDNIGAIDNLKRPEIYLRYAKKIQRMGRKALGEESSLVLRHLQVLKSASLSL